MSVRSRLSWLLFGARRVGQLESAVVELQARLEMLTAQQEATLEDIRRSASTVLDDLDARVVALDDQLAE